MSDRAAFTLEHCRACDYDLQGLERPGRCPECGEPFSETDMQVRGNSFTQRGSNWLLLWMPTWALLIGPMRNWIPQYQIYYIWFGVILALVATAYWFRRKRLQKERGGARYVTITDRGVIAAGGPSDAPIIPWSRIKRWKIATYRPNRLTWTKPVGAMQHLTFSSGSIFDINRMTGRAPGPFEHARTYIDVMFEADAEDVSDLKRRIEALSGINGS